MAKAAKFQEFSTINNQFSIISLETLECRASGEKIEPQNDNLKFSNGGLIYIPLKIRVDEQRGFF